jgi:hypothetical protein
MFGLTPLNVISSFSGTISGDFQYSENLSHDVVSQEIEIQSDYLLSLLNPATKSFLNEINYELCQVTSVSGDLWSLRLSLPASSIYNCIAVLKNTLVCTQEDLESCWDCYQNYVNNISLTQIDSQTYQFTYVGFNSSCQQIAVKYYVDSSNVSVPALKKILRDMVCANLSSRIYSIQDGKNAPITQYYIDQVKSAEKMLSGNWIPNTFSNIKLLFPKKPFTTYRINRS